MRGAGQLRRTIVGRLAGRLGLELLALPAPGRPLLGGVRVGRRVIGPAVAGRRPDVDVDEVAAGIDADAHAPAIECLCEGFDLLGADPGDADVAGAPLEMVA